MKRFLRKTLVWLARAAAILIILLVIFYAEENWRGPHDWAAYRKVLQARGESLDLRQLAPPGNPEDDLSKVPLFTRSYREKPGYYIGYLGAIPAPRQLSHLDINLGSEDAYKSPGLANYIERQPTNLAAWQKFYRSLPEAHLSAPIGTPAQDVLATLSQFDGQLNEIEAAINRPRAFWSIDFARPFLTPSEGPAFMDTLGKIYSLKASAHLDNGEPGLAENDYLASLNLCLPLTKGCFLFKYMTIGIICSNSNAILWEGLRRHAWDNAQLHAMESALASLDMIALAKESFRFERASTLQMMNLYQNPDPDFLRLTEIQRDQTITVLRRLSLVRPSGWWDQDRLRCSIDNQSRIDGMDLAKGTVLSTTFSPETNICKRVSMAIYTPVSFVQENSIQFINTWIAKTETYRRLARLACRLEEYRIANGRYPEALDKLPGLPAHLNQEVVSERPLRYACKGNGYQLYSVG